jgi:hypothetical protein
MFSVGQTVWLRNGQRSGTVLECDGDRVYIQQDNGVELDFRASDLTAQRPAGADPAVAALKASVRAAKSAGKAPPARALTPRDITPEHVRVLGIVPIRTVKAVAALFERRQCAGRFSALDTAAKLNVITEMTSVPYRTMEQYSDRPGELSLLMGKGLADSSK